MVAEVFLATGAFKCALHYARIRALFLFPRRIPTNVLRGVFARATRVATTLLHARTCTCMEARVHVINRVDHTARASCRSTSLHEGQFSSTPRLHPHAGEKAHAQIVLHRAHTHARIHRTFFLSARPLRGGGGWRCGTHSLWGERWSTWPSRTPQRPIGSSAVIISIHHVGEQTRTHRTASRTHPTARTIQDIFLIGPPSARRRRLALWYAQLVGREVEYVAISRDTTEADLKQRREIVGGSVVYVDQAPVRAAVRGKYTRPAASSLYCGCLPRLHDSALRRDCLVTSLCSAELVSTLGRGLGFSHPDAVD